MLLLLAAAAHALTSHRTAVGFDLGAGLGLAGQPIRAAVAGQVGVGIYRGQFDDQFSFGRYWWIGPTGRFDVRPDGGLTAMPMLDLRRGVDLLVAGFTYGIAGGPLLVAGGPVGATARATGSARFRRNRVFSFAARLEAGVDLVRGRPSFGGAFTLGGFLGAPLQASPP